MWASGVWFPDGRAGGAARDRSVDAPLDASRTRRDERESEVTVVKVGLGLSRGGWRHTFGLGLHRSDRPSHRF